MIESVMKSDIANPSRNGSWATHFTSIIAKGPQAADGSVLQRKIAPKPNATVHAIVKAMAALVTLSNTDL